MSQRNICLVVEYDGGRYDGYLRMGKDGQKNTIEDKLKNCLGIMLGCDTELFCACRTEKGVHAHGQVVNFKTDSTMSNRDMKNYLNRYLPRDIAIIECKDMPPRFHAALNAVSKTFLYRIDTKDVANVFERYYTYHSFSKLNIKAMKDCSNLFIGEHDFKVLSGVKKGKSTVRKVSAIDIYDDGEEVSIFITANDFLHNMARYIVALLIEVGKGNITMTTVSRILEGTMPLEVDAIDPCGMYLEHVEFITK